jgi:crotonobetainyl-CoA:carnitine CoA-transferase CaiB-like acyl-CoA transferase
MTQPLHGIRVLDFSTLLPGPMAGLILAEAGAEVIKIERPGYGEEMRLYEPRFGETSANFALLNRGKKSLALDLKDAVTIARLRTLIAESHVILEQFRPGVMARLGLGYDDVRKINPAIVYCSITGYGQTGPKANTAAHDLNYIGDTGLLALSAGADGAPIPPPGLIADIGGGSLPAVINILLALREAERTGKGTHLDIAMCDNVFAWQYWAIATLESEGRTPVPGKELVTGGTPRYRIYQTADGRFAAVAALEQKFWDNLCGLLGLAEALRDDRRNPEATAAGVAAIIASKPAAHWRKEFATRDVCCSIVQDMAEAMADPHFRARGLFGRRVVDGAQSLTAVPVPVAPQFRSKERDTGYPRLGDANAMLDGTGED